MFYTIYKITNLINNKIYIGKHTTKNLDDGYMGSGKHLKRAIKKYGVEIFKKEILFVFDNEFDMNSKEKELVTEEFCIQENTYNICVGGQGGFGYINQTKKRNGFELTRNLDEYKETFKKCSSKGGKTYANKIKTDEEFRRNHYEKCVSKLPKDGSHWIDRKHSEQTIEKMKLSKIGHGISENNSQYNTCWITNGTSNKKIKKEVDIIPEGWYKGRTIKSGDK